jgi:hypothetical protein
MSPFGLFPPCLAFCLLATGARAESGCRGSLSASALQPVAAGTPVILDILSQDAANTALSERFAAGMRAVGAQIEAAGNLHLRLNFLLRDPSTGGVYSDFSWLADPAGADNPIARDGPRPVIMLTATLTDTANAALVWVALVDCVIDTKSTETLAFDLGREIGRWLGKNEPAENF